MNLRGMQGNGKPFILGLTGPSGGGKSTVAAYLKEQGVPSVDADLAAREVVEPGRPALKKLSAAFSDDILLPDGRLDRRELARRAFASREKTDLLNSILHPFIIEWMERRLKAQIAEGHPVILLDAPQLYEAGAENLCDAVVAVVAPAEIRLARIMERDGLSEKDARLRMAAGLNEDFFRDRGAHILVNDKNKADLLRDTADLLDRIIGE